MIKILTIPLTNDIVSFEQLGLDIPAKYNSFISLHSGVYETLLLLFKFDPYRPADDMVYFFFLKKKNNNKKTNKKKKKKKKKKKTTTKNLLILVWLD